MAASQQAGYVNRVKLLQFIETRVVAPIVEQMLKKEKEEAEAELADTGVKEESEADAVEGSGTTAHHAPQFIDDDASKKESLSGHKRVLAPEKFVEGFAKAPEQVNKLSKTGQLIKSKAKEAAQDQDRNFRQYTTSLSASLEQKGWAVCDNFISPDLVRRVREYGVPSYVVCSKGYSFVMLLYIPLLLGH